MLHRTMKAIIWLAVAGIFFAMGATRMNAETEKEKMASHNPTVIMETTKGTMTIELYPEEAPLTVKNFLYYVDHKFYDNLTFHRIVPNFVIQGGGFTKDMIKKETNPPIKNEADNGLKNAKYTLSMARLPQKDTATSQFFINLKNNSNLDHHGDANFGYAVFAKVIEGQEVVDAIAKVETARIKGMDDVPVTPVIMTKVYRAEEAEMNKKG